MKTIINTVKANEINGISITAKRWFQRSYGNTYHSVNVAALVDVSVANRLNANTYNQSQGELWIDIGIETFAYGYERHFETTALEILCEAVEDCPDTWKKYYYIRQAAESMGVNYSENVYDVSRKKDL